MKAPGSQVKRKAQDPRRTEAVLGLRGNPKPGVCFASGQSKTVMVTTHLKICGRVQGVGFRYHMCRVANELGITGWVRNRRDGSVEAMVSGAPDAVEKIIAWAQRGPGHAVVTAVDIGAGDGSYERFDTLPTE